MTARARVSTPLSLIFFVSGAVALIYQVLWQRQFMLVFGSAAPATAAVLAAFLAGLCIGNLLAQRFAFGRFNPLRAYAALEVLIAIGALSVPLLLRTFDHFYPAFFADGANPTFAFIGKFLCAVIVVLVPTVCMGATLPVLADVVSARERALGVSAGWLYVVNTAGAAFGALSVPFVFLPGFGSGITLRICVALNLLLAFSAWLLGPASAALVAERAKSYAQPVRLYRNPVFALAFLSGVVAFICQVLWNRAFAQVHENSIYSFAVIAAGFILALAIGGQISRRLLLRGKPPLAIFGWSWFTAGCAVAVSPWVFLQLTNGLGYIGAGKAWTGYALHLVGTLALSVLVPITAFGAGFPALLEHAARILPGPPRVIVGQILSVNLAGAAAGATLAGVAFPRLVGLWSSIVLTAAILVLVGLHYAKASRLLRIITGALALIAIVISADLPRTRLVAQRGERLLSISEGAHGIVAVTERPNSLRLKLNNHYVLGGSAALGDERMQAHLPILLHPSPEQVAFLGVGTGITASGALFHPIERLAAVELVPEVIRAAREHFGAPNLNVLTDARTSVVIDDARNFLRHSRQKFDVIIGDLVVPWRQGESALFTLEHFTAVQGGLADEGVFCQWVPLFQLSEDEFNILLRTFLQVFQRVSVWRGDFSPTEPALALISGPVNASKIETRLAQMKPDPANTHLAHPELFWMCFVGWIEASQISERRVNSEDMPWLELLAPMTHAGERNDVALTGRRFQAWSKKVRRNSHDRIKELGPVAVSGSAVGELLFESSLLTLERRSDELERVQQTLRATLSQAAFAALFPVNNSGLKTP